MFAYQDTYKVNPILRWLWAHGWEEPIGPLGPLNQQFGPAAERAQFGPQPEPWRVAVPQLLQAVQARDLATRLEGNAKEELLRSSETAIQSILDDWCGNSPRRFPWPYPGPPPWAWEIASQLGLVANTIQAGTMRDDLLAIAARAVQQSRD